MFTMNRGTRNGSGELTDETKNRRRNWVGEDTRVYIKDTITNFERVIIAEMRLQILRGSLWKGCERRYLKRGDVVRGSWSNT